MAVLVSLSRTVALHACSCVMGIENSDDAVHRSVSRLSRSTSLAFTDVALVKIYSACIARQIR